MDAQPLLDSPASPAALPVPMPAALRTPWPAGAATPAAVPWPVVASALIDGLADPAWLVDATTLRLFAANAPAEALQGVARGALCGRPVLELADTPEDLVFWSEAATADMTDADGGLDGIDSLTSVRAADGSLCPVRRRVSRLVLPAGGACWLVVLHDQRERQRAEAEHARRMAQLNATLEATADGLLVTDALGRIVNFNRRFAALWALPRELASRRDDDEVLSWLRQRVADPAAYMRRLARIDAAADEPAHDTLLLRGGRRVERIGVPLHGESGEPAGRVWSFREAARAQSPA